MNKGKSWAEGFCYDNSGRSYYLEQYLTKPGIEPDIAFTSFYNSTEEIWITDCSTSPLPAVCPKCGSPSFGNNRYLLFCLGPQSQYTVQTAAVRWNCVFCNEDISIQCDDETGCRPYSLNGSMLLPERLYELERVNWHALERFLKEKSQNGAAQISFSDQSGSKIHSLANIVHCTESILVSHCILLPTLTDEYLPEVVRRWKRAVPFIPDILYRPNEAADLNADETNDLDADETADLDTDEKTDLNADKAADLNADETTVPVNSEISHEPLFFSGKAKEKIQPTFHFSRTLCMGILFLGIFAVLWKMELWNSSLNTNSVRGMSGISVIVFTVGGIGCYLLIKSLMDDE